MFICMFIAISLCFLLLCFDLLMYSVFATAALRQYHCMFFQPHHYPSIHLQAPTVGSVCFAHHSSITPVCVNLGSDEVRARTPNTLNV